MKIYVSTAFRDQIDQASGEVRPEYREFISSVLHLLRSEEGEVYSAIEQSDWRMSDQPAEVGVQRNLDGINHSDVIVALVQAAPSAGQQFELGYSVAKDKKVILAKQMSDELTFFSKGIISSGLVTLVEYDSVDTLLQLLALALNAPED